MVTSLGTMRFDVRSATGRGQGLGIGYSAGNSGNIGVVGPMRQFGICLGGLGAAAVALAVVIGMESEVAAARSGVDPATVNRVLKGDRLPLTRSRGATDVRPTMDRPVEAPRALQPKLPDECTLVFN